jgi:hypothetical protein
MNVHTNNAIYNMQCSHDVAVSNSKSCSSYVIWASYYTDWSWCFYHNIQVAYKICVFILFHQISLLRCCAWKKDNWLVWFGFMVLNATFNNISVILRRSFYWWGKPNMWSWYKLNTVMRYRSWFGLLCLPANSLPFIFLQFYISISHVRC